jgi:HAD superfamily hydrolase (TIGR01549 family)
MITTILFDLDNTLLGNGMDTFLPHYFALLDTFTRKTFRNGSLLPAILAASEQMVNNNPSDKSNSDVFWYHLTRQIDLDRAKLENGFEQFYQTEFNTLEKFTARWPAAVDLVRTAFAKGLQVVIATNPMFPRTAVESRLAWAGIPATDFPFSLITTYENMHATKPHPAYYQEIMNRVGCKPEHALMVGDDWQRDIEPAASLGLATYWIQLPGIEPPDATLPTAYGSPEGLLARMQSGWLQRLGMTI